MITISAFRWVPTFARGLVRDLRVRWALEEAGLPYEAWLIGPDDQKSEATVRCSHLGKCLHTKKTAWSFSKVGRSSCTLQIALRS